MLLSPLSGPGKLSPKLWKDWLLFDPAHSSNASGNLLADHPHPVGEGPQPAPGIGSCKHDYTTKSSQSVVPPLDLRPDGSSRYRIATICKKCRLHADVSIDYRRSTDACPTSGFPLHHFQRTSSGDLVENGRLRYAWQCSAPQCQAQLHVTYRLPRISTREKELLTDTELLKQRYDVVVQQEPTREGVRQATPAESLSRLRRYVKDSLDPKHPKRTFPANNKRFMEAFGLYGEDCHDLLVRLGFKYAELTWSLPDPAEIEDRLEADGASERELLEDVELELVSWMYQLSSETGAINPSAAEGWPSANRDVERALAAQGYQRYVPIRRSAATNEEIPYYSSLGAVPDFADSLIEFAYNRQTLCEPERQSYYFECLQMIAESRQTESLQVKVATLQSQELVSRRDLSAAYRYLEVTARGDPRQVSDEQIVALYQSRLPDLGPSAAEEAKQALYKIGLARHSQLLLNASRQSVETYADALAWLGNGVNKDTSDEMLLSVLAMKTSENSANEEIGQKAISAIAKARQSNYLNSWLLTGRIDSDSMDVKEALRHLNIDQDLKDLDPTVVPAIFESARADRPSDMTEKAIKSIEQALAGQSQTQEHALETWPVGLTSHGNTCYLNSLLQYYFSIKPLRDIILRYDEYKMDMEANPNKDVRVGQRPISMVEIKGGQRFAEDLRFLFERMIKEPSTAVKPEEDLVCRAFLPPSEYDLLASSIRDQAQSEPNTAGVVEETVDAEAARQSSEASSVTLVDGNDTDIVMVAAPGSDMPPTPPASPKIKGQEQLQPSHAPPLPPRRFSTTKEQALALAQEKARQQQDVTEVHDSVMWRLRAGVSPKGSDEAGEQWDDLRALFDIGMTETTIIDGKASKPNPTFDSNIQLNVPEEATDINSALDDVFDLQQFEGNEKMETYKSIRRLPQLMQISIPRIGFDKKTGQAFKSDKMVKLADELHFDRFCDFSDPEILPKRRECWQWRKQLRERRKEQKALQESSVVADIDGPTTIAQAAKYIESLQSVNKDLKDRDEEQIDLDESLVTALSEESRQQSVLLAKLSGEIDELRRRLDAQFQDFQTQPAYRLAAVFFHRGAAGHGHYWIYIKDFADNVWRSYNDERVEACSASRVDEIFEARTWQHGTPTYAVYIRDDLKAQNIQPVFRHPEQPPPPPPSSQAAQPQATQAATAWADAEDTWNPDSGKQEDQEMAEIVPKQPFTHVDAQVLMEGGAASWDAPREIGIPKSDW